jgi:hypothetical protein
MDFTFTVSPFSAYDAVAYGTEHLPDNIFREIDIQVSYKVMNKI